jgi:glycosyltransferase involved in cell wall biosynthesis
MLNEGCDLWIFPSQDAYAYLMPVNALATIHDLMHRYERKFPEVGSEKEYKIREFHYQNMSHFAKGILVDSELGKQHVIESYGIAQENCHVLAYIAPKDIHKHYSIDFDKKFRLPAKFLLYPAQFWEHKNHANLLKALAKCRERCSDIQLVLVGSKKNGYEKAIQLISDLKLEDAVHILGYVDDNDLIELYRRARGLIMPTFFGPTNIPPLEAHAIGCPVAISGIYAMRDQLGNAALFFDPYQVEDILDKLTLIWQDDVLCKDLILKGQERHQLWNFDHFKSKLIDILNTMLHISSEPRQYRSR